MSKSIIWITGASSGIGRELSVSVPWEGARVINVSRRSIERADNVAADLATPEGWRATAESFGRELSGFEGERAVLLHCAATLEPIGFAGEVDAEAYQRASLLNSVAPQVLGDAFLRALRGTQARGTIVMVSSGAASKPYPGMSMYGAGKAAMDQWVRVAGVEQDARGGGCRVVAVSPGVVETPMQVQIRATDAHDFPKKPRFVELHEAGATRSPATVAGEIWRLLSSSFENGSVVDLRDLA